MTMKKVSIDARYIGKEFTGIGAYSKCYLQALSGLHLDLDFQVIVHASCAEDLDLADNFKIVKSPHSPVSTQSFMFWDRQVRSFCPDVVHVLAPIVPLFDKNLGTLISTVHDLQPLLDPQFTEHGNYLSSAAYKAFYRYTYPNSMRKADWIVCPSYSTKNTISERVPDVTDRVIVIHEAVPDEEDLLKAPEPKTIQYVKDALRIPERFILYIGSTRPNKNLDNMLKAFDEFIKQDESQKDLHLVLIIKPDRFWSSVSEEIRNRGLTDRVHIYEQVSQRRKKVFLYLAELLFFVTKFEGFGLPVLEAQAVGLPVLASTHSSLPEISGDAALMADADSVESIVKKLTEYYSDYDSLRKLMITEGKQNVKRFSWSNVVKEHIILYKIMAGLDFHDDLHKI